MSRAVVSRAVNTIGVPPSLAPRFSKRDALSVIGTLGIETGSALIVLNVVDPKAVGSVTATSDVARLGDRYHLIEGDAIDPV